MNKHNKVVFATVRESETWDGNTEWDIECRFLDGQKYAAIRVCGDQEWLADKIANMLNEEG